MGRGKLLGKPGKILLEEVACNGLLAFHWGWGGGGEGGQFLESLHATDSDRNTFWLNGPLF